MADYDLKGTQADAKVELSQFIGRVRLAGDWQNFRADMRVICDNFLTLAAASLLADMKVNFFFLNLCRCAENWRRFLLTSREYFHRHVPLTYNAPLYAAIIANDPNIVRGIAAALPQDWLPGEEYEDEFRKLKLYAQLATNGVALDKAVEEQLHLLEAAEQEPMVSGLFKALLGIDDLTEEDFWSQFEVALYAHEEQTEQKINGVATKINQFIAHRFIWFEGLAWLCIAKHRGFVLPSANIKYCPDEALGVMPEKYNGDWPLIPLPQSS